MDTVDLLYITFVDLKGPANSGSSVRPQQMLRAFREIGCSIKILDGWHNNRKERRSHVREIMQWLDTHHVRYCYVEPPAGPFFVREDLMLLKKLHKMSVPIGLFYRDIYWRFPEQFTEINPLKFFIIQCLQKRDLSVFKKTVSLFYFPTDQMAKIADFGMPYDVLPPGAEVMKESGQSEEDDKRILQEDILTLFFVGGLSPGYGFDVLLDAMKIINRDALKLRLLAVCREQEWLDFQKRYSFVQPNWLEIHHVSFGNGLEELYRKADLGVLPIRKSIYRDFAISVKLFEYIAHEKPILCTNVDAMSQIVQENDLGWICKDTAEDMAKALEDIIANRPMMMEKKENIKQFLPANTWKARARKVFSTLESVNKKNK
ncbi:glycosyltransferase family 4 protein [Murdochiella vaginalis]|uniref:glycosyltransferase family 4 protein n=1 Tax=Murdochiella vaginalis TaxID=1852373 RepID=UPI0008FE4F6F|nr:glycosyltransferase family 4 protein [Murdochiella vaginalis]